MIESEIGLLCQIATGEGKSTIVSVIATIKALQGYKVDVITSSLILAKRDAHEKDNFYQMFNLKVRHNGDHNYNFKDVKECY
jgi:preprotein translocase subunit SecA